MVQDSITHTGANGLTVTYNAKMWISERLAFPLRETITTEGGATTTIEFSNVHVGPLPGGTFSLPADASLTAA